MRVAILASLAVLIGVCAGGSASAQPLPTGVGDNSADAPLLNGPKDVDASQATSLKAGVIPAPVGPNVTRSVTVTGHLPRPCGKRDQACITSISEEIWKKYPKEIETLCSHQAVYAVQEGFQEEAMGVQGIINNHMTPQTQALCDYGAKMKKQQAAAAPSSAPPSPNQP